MNTMALHLACAQETAYGVRCLDYWLRGPSGMDLSPAPDVIMFNWGMHDYSTSGTGGAYQFDHEGAAHPLFVLTVVLLTHRNRMQCPDRAATRPSTRLSSPISQLVSWPMQLLSHTHL